MAAGAAAGEQHSHHGSDCGLWIADCGFEGASSMCDAGHTPRRALGAIRIPKSAIRNVMLPRSAALFQC